MRVINSLKVRAISAKIIYVLISLSDPAILEVIVKPFKNALKCLLLTNTEHLF